MPKITKKQASKKTCEEMPKWWQDRLIRHIEEVMALRQAIDTAEAEMMYYLVNLEKRSDHWWCGDLPTFDDLLVRFNICSPQRYDRFKKTVRTIPEPLVRRIGVHGSIEAFKVRDIAKRGALITALHQFRQENHTVASRRTAASYRKQITGDTGIPSPLRRYGKALEDRKEIALLKSIIKDLKKKLRTERTENLRLHKELAKYKKKK